MTIQATTKTTTKTITTLTILATLLLICSLSSATRPEPDSKKPSKGKGGGDDGRVGGFFAPGFGDIPGFRNGWGDIGGGGGYGAGYGGPHGGYSRGGVIKPTVVCKEKGPCYKKKLTCPAKCFTSYSRSGKSYGAGAGGGGCTVDCNKKCVAYC